MKYPHLKHFFIVALTCTIAMTFFSGCRIFASSEMKIVNESNMMVDSVLISVNGSRPQKEYKIAPHTQKTFALKLKHVKLNAHDVNIKADLYSGGEKVGFASHYNDLINPLSSKYEVMFLQKGGRATIRSVRDYAGF